MYQILQKISFIILRYGYLQNNDKMYAMNLLTQTPF